MTPPLSMKVLAEHFHNYEARIYALRSEIQSEAECVYKALLQEHGLNIGDRVKYHNAEYFISKHVIICTDFKNEVCIEFALARIMDRSSHRWLPLEFLDELIKIND